MSIFMLGIETSNKWEFKIVGLKGNSKKKNAG